MINVYIHPEDLAILNVYKYKNKVSKYIKQKLLEVQREIDKSVITVRHFTTTLRTEITCSR